MSQTELFDLRVAQEHLFKLRFLTDNALKEASRNLELATLGRDDMNELRKRAAVGLKEMGNELLKLARSLGCSIYIGPDVHSAN